MGLVDAKSIDGVRLQPVAFKPSAILSGDPRARYAELSRSRDGSAVTVVWDCTAGEFNWTYTEDETVHILEGEAIIDDGSSMRTIRSGDVYLFPAGTTYRWRVPTYVKKLAFLRAPLPPVAIFAIRGMRRLRLGMRSPGARSASLGARRACSFHPLLSSDD